MIFVELIKITVAVTILKIKFVLIIIFFKTKFLFCLKAYVACTTPKSSVGYVLFAYGLIATFLSGFLCAAIRHISRITILFAGFACQAGALVVMWMWKPVSDDQPILYVIATSWSMADSIWKILLQSINLIRGIIFSNNHKFTFIYS